MQIEFTAAPGTSLLAKSLPNGHMIKGIQIDNPSGNWLYVVSEQLFCPPYTIGWAIPTTYDQSSINVEARLTGPANQVGTNQGENWRLNLFDVEVAPSAGVPYSFVNQFTAQSKSPTTTLASSLFAAQSIQVLPTVVNKRYRLKSLFIRTNTIVAYTEFILPWIILQAPFSTNVIGGTLISRDKEADYLFFGDGLDCPNGGGALSLFLPGAQLSPPSVDIDIYYELI